MIALQILLGLQMVARLPAQRTLQALMDSLPEIAGFTKLHHQVVDHLLLPALTKRAGRFISSSTDYRGAEDALTV